MQVLLNFLKVDNLFCSELISNKFLVVADKLEEYM